jgi:hypothetical protein
VTLIDDNNETYDCEDVDVVFEKGLSYNKLTWKSVDDIPKSIRGCAPSLVQGWDIVVTIDDETVGGTIRGWDGDTCEFY